MGGKAMEHVTLVILLLLSIVIAWDYRGQSKIKRTTDEHRQFLRWYRFGILILSAAAVIGFVFTTREPARNVSNQADSFRVTAIVGAVCALTLSYFYFLTFVNPDKNKITRFIDWLMSQRFIRGMQIDSKRQVFVIAAITFLIGMVSIVLSITGIPQWLKR